VKGLEMLHLFREGFVGRTSLVFLSVLMVPISLWGQMPPPAPDIPAVPSGDIPPPPDIPAVPSGEDPLTSGDIPPADTPPSQGDIAPPPAPGAVNDDVGATLSAVLAPFIYEADSRRDPFRPSTTGIPLVQEEAIGPLLPLQRFSLDELKLVGIIWDVARPKAMFTDPEKKVHVLEKDDRIGRNNGYIAVIREGEVVIVETVNIRGELTYSTRVLSITR
jgi:type IV pilus assembly protein PilP